MQQFKMSPSLHILLRVLGEEEGIIERGSLDHLQPKWAGALYILGSFTQLTEPAASM